MCISILSTAHPDYPFILLSNRDEFINRPTLRADWWDAPHQQVLAGRDTQRAERGTWLGITKQGRFAVLTNFREAGVEVNRDKSRGGIINAWLTATDEPEEAFVNRLLNEVGIYDCGGFTLLFGELRAASQAQQLGSLNTETGGPTLLGLARISNRTQSAFDLERIATALGETHGLSNSHFGDRSWPKVVQGEQLLNRAIEDHVSNGESREDLIKSSFEVLSVDSLPRRKHCEAWEVYTGNMRRSIFIPPAKGNVVENSKGEDLAIADGKVASDMALVQVGEGAYGTRNQTVILVDRSGTVTFVERTLYDVKGMPVHPSERDRVVNFQIEGWEEAGSSSLTSPGSKL